MSESGRPEGQDAQALFEAMQQVIRRIIDRSVAMQDAADENFTRTLSGPSGELDQLTNGCSELNGFLTNSLDSLFGPNDVDSLDASCNTCKHFARSPMNAEEKMVRNIFGMPGRCTAKNVNVTGWQRGQYCPENRSCYENRRTGMRPAEACRPQPLCG